ncbi:hypothetical protein G6F31_021756 [Rhizopus arrhizus]|nr:hypothetical protein G6F31_021756 [Rhizopus arrhizus]
MRNRAGATWLAVAILASMRCTSASGSPRCLRASAAVPTTADSVAAPAARPAAVPASSPNSGTADSTMVSTSSASMIGSTM